MGYWHKMDSAMKGGKIMTPIEDHCLAHTETSWLTSAANWLVWYGWNIGLKWIK